MARATRAGRAITPRPTPVRAVDGSNVGRAALIRPSSAPLRHHLRTQGWRRRNGCPSKRHGHDSDHTGNHPLHQLPYKKGSCASATVAVRQPDWHIQTRDTLDSKQTSPAGATESSFQVSTIIVTGPSFTRLTRIMTPKRPVATSAPVLVTSPPPGRPACSPIPGAPPSRTTGDVLCWCLRKA